MAWAREMGMQIHSLQHDCVVVGKKGEEAADVEEGKWIAANMSTWATEATQYDVQVKATWAEEWTSVVWAD